MNRWRFGKSLARGVSMSMECILIALAASVVSLLTGPECTIAGSLRAGAGLAKLYCAAASGQQPSGTVRFELYDNSILLPVRANGSQPLSFILDTGASMSFLSQRQARALGLAIGHEQQGNFGTGEGHSKIGFARDVRLELAETSLPLKSVVVLPTDDLEAMFGHRMDGILGAEFFKRYVVEVDYDARALRFYEPGTYVYQGSGETLLLTLSGGRPFVMAAVTIAGLGRIEGKFILDLGDSRALELNNPFVRKHSILSVEQKTIQNVAHGIAGGAPEVLGRLDRLELGGTVLRGLVTAFSTATRGSTSSSAYDGVIGTEILRRFKIIFDYSRRRIMLEPGASLGEPFDVGMLGVSWVAKGSDLRTFEIDSVQDRSPAAEAGLLAGDIVVSIDGRRAAEFSLGEMKQMFRRNGTEYTLEIRRGDQVLKVRLKTRRLI